MTVECPRCHRAKWHVTGATDTNRFQRLRAAVVCDACGYVWSTGLPAAMQALEAWRAAHGDEPSESPRTEPAPPTVPVPAPTLFGGTLVPQSQGFVKVGALRRAVPAAIRSVLPREPGEDD
jgi:hypothetical protein